MRLSGKISSVLFVCLLLVSFVAEPKQNGFNCNDQSIREPFIQLQIGITKLLSFCILIPIIVFIVSENLFKASTETPVKASINHNIRVLMFGLLINFLLVMISKNLFGRLRPHAVHFCNASHYCSEGLIDKYIDSFECRNEQHSELMLKNVRHSFYSGHASLGVYSGVFIILYLRRKLRPKSKAIQFLLTIVYMTTAVISLYPGFTQWYNYWHFASDVFTGYVIGLLTAFLVFRVFTTDSSSEQNKSNNYMPLNKLLTTAFLPIH